MLGSLSIFVCEPEEKHMLSFTRFRHEIALLNALIFILIPARVTRQGLWTPLTHELVHGQTGVGDTARRGQNANNGGASVFDNGFESTHDNPLETRTGLEPAYLCFAGRTVTNSGHRVNKDGPSRET